MRITKNHVLGLCVAFFAFTTIAAVSAAYVLGANEPPPVRHPKKLKVYQGGKK